MKKILLTAIVVVSMSLASFANNTNAMQVNSNGSNIECIKTAGPHTQQYKDIKKVLDEFEQNVKITNTCEDLDDVTTTMLFKLLYLVESDYAEEMTEEEDKELSDQMDRIDSEIQKLQKQLGCESEGDGDEE